MLRFEIIPKRLIFKQPAGTSRGIYNTRDIWLLSVTDDCLPGRVGLGECAPLPNLSCDHIPNYNALLARFCEKTAVDNTIPYNDMKCYPSMLFGIETALRHLGRGSYALWDTPFSRGEEGIMINGLIWMGEYKMMLKQIEAKMKQGFRCIKLKIGAIDFDDEIKLLKIIRSHFSKNEVELRVDANGAFDPSDASEKLKRLSEYDIHSIEQPIMAGQYDEMARLISESPLPIALDEELIGRNEKKDKIELLDCIKPQYIVLKPSLHGGYSGCKEWIDLAEERKIGWWITSALESNIGLNAIAQWCATLRNPLPQGLGTGALYTNNIDLPLKVMGDCLWFKP